ncbi:uncharacterized [Tachysurus ichikawai]
MADRHVVVFEFNSCSCRRLSPNHSSYSPQLSGIHFKLCLCTLPPRTSLLPFLYLSLRHSGKRDCSERAASFLAVSSN